MSPNEFESLPLSMLTLEAFPTQDEKGAIDAYERAWEAICRPAGDAFLNRYFSGMPELGSVVTSARAASKSVLADLYLGKQTFAQSNRQLQALYVSYRETIAKIAAAYQQRQQAQAAAFAQAYLNSLPRTSTTNCYGGGGFATCTTTSR